MQRSLNNFVLIIAAISGFLWVLIGAMTGHQSLGSPYLSYMEKAQRYHIMHTLVCLWLAIQIINKSRIIVVMAFMVGILCFSGSLYLMAIYHWPLNFIVPIGGLSFLLGWLVLIYDAVKRT